MAYGVIYRGSFLSRGDVVWRVDLLRETDGVMPERGELTFPADGAVEIEWPERAKHDPVCSSGCTVTVVSPSDREYAWLYTTKPRDVRIAIYRDGTLYWSGTLDPEVYEEPYERAWGYDVRLTFADFGPLDRVKFRGTGLMSVRNVINLCVNESKCGMTGLVDTSLVSTTIPESEGNILDDIYVDCANFYDEEGEASTLMDVLKGVLQPLGLRIVQRGGLFHVYDLNGLYHNAETAETEWSGDHQTLSVDNVYNNCNITFSPYVADGSLTDTTPMGDDEISANLRNRNSHNFKPYGDSVYWSWPAEPDKRVWLNAANDGFTAFFARRFEDGNVKLGGGANFVRFVPQLSGQEKQGVAIIWSTWVGSAAGLTEESNNREIDALSVQMQGAAATANPATYNPRSVLGDAKTADGAYVDVTVDLPPLDADQRVRIAFDALVGYGPTPFNTEIDLPAGVWNAMSSIAAYKETLEEKAHILRIPVAITYETDGGDRYYWVPDNPLPRLSSIWQTEGQWRAWDGRLSTAKTYLTAYEEGLLTDGTDDYKGTVIGKGWSPIRQNVVTFGEATGKNLFKQNDAQYIACPSSMFGGGTLRLRILNGGWGACKRDGSTEIAEVFGLRYSWTWLCVTVPEVKVVPRGYDGPVTTDVVYEGELDANAKDALDIETICGTVRHGRPMARGCYVYADQSQVQSLQRGGRTALPEDLFVGTCYSQYATRHDKIEGEMSLPSASVNTYIDRNEEGKKFILVGVTEHCIEDTADATLVELSGDEYTHD